MVLKDEKVEGGERERREKKVREKTKNSPFFFFPFSPAFESSLSLPFLQKISLSISPARAGGTRAKSPETAQRRRKSERKKEEERKRKSPPMFFLPLLSLSLSLSLTPLEKEQNGSGQKKKQNTYQV